MDLCTFDAATIGTGHIFPEEIRDTDWIGYHGTCSYHSRDIEEGGLRCAKPITPPQFQLLERLAAELRLDFRPVAHFRDYQTTSFSPLSELALSFTSPDKRGGQGLGYVKSLVDSITRHQAFDAAADYAEQLRLIQTTITAIRQGTPVVYAVNLDQQPALCYDVATHAIQTTAEIGHARLRAKMPITNFADYPRINQNALFATIDNLFWRPDSTHFIKRI